MKTYSILVLAVMVLCTGTTANARYSGGTGEPNDPYRIATPQDLNDIGNYEEDWDKHFILVNDVNLAQYTGTQFNIIGTYSTPFTGVFDGNDHKVWNFTWSSTGSNYIGLFEYVVGGWVKNLRMENVDVNAAAGYYTGGLVGYNRGTISNCYSTGSVSGLHIVGGLVGINLGRLTNCYSTGNVTGNDRVGGLMGHNCADYSYVMVTDCYSTGSVDGNEYVGGLAGENSYLHAWIRNCYSTSNVSGRRWVGGLVGDNYQGGTITNTYSTGSVLGNDSVGGLVGYGWTGYVTVSFWDVNTSGQSESAGGTPKTTAEMKTQSTFTDAGWDFVEIWGIGEHQTYPFLRTEPAGDSNHDKKVDLVDLAILASHWLEENQ